MNKQQVWCKTSKSLMPPICGYVKIKWVFKMKCNGVYWASLIICGYSQVPCIYFSESNLSRTTADGTTLWLVDVNTALKKKFICSVPKACPT